jgi:hypothetical protein
MSPTDEWREKWNRKIKASQLIPSYGIGGESFTRVKYGEESSDWGADGHACGDCAVEKGQFHVPNCDVEECPKCGGQAISCDCETDVPDLESIGKS